MLQASHIACWRGSRWVIRRVHLTVQPGQLWQLVGENGSGKSTLLAILAGLLKPQRGTVRWRGQPLSWEYGLEMQFLGHQLAIKPQLTIQENCHAFQSSRLLSPRLSTAAIESACQRVGLTLPLNTLGRGLSQGQQKKLALARLLIQPSAKLWLLDEPFSALDGNSLLLWQQQMVVHIQAGGLIVMTSHQTGLDFSIPVQTLALTTSTTPATSETPAIPATRTTSATSVTLTTSTPPSRVTHV